MDSSFYGPGDRIRFNQGVAAKPKTNQPLTSEDVKVLEGILWGELGSRQDYENEYGGKPLGEFVREIVGLDINAAKEAFAEFLNDTSLDSAQIVFCEPDCGIHRSKRTYEGFVCAAGCSIY